MMRYQNLIRRSVFLIAISATLVSVAFSQTTAFNYQGSLNDGGNPANGSFQMQFKLFDSLGGPTQIDSTIADVPVTVNQGMFAVKLDFGSNAFSGANRWLEIAIRHNSGEGYTTLTPREQIASSPYSVRTLSAGTADNALNLGGVAANQYLTIANVGTSFIQNTTSQQALSNFNISGNGVVGGGLTASGNSGTTAVIGNGIGGNTGVFGTSSGFGVYGLSNSATGTGVYGSASGASGRGVFGENSGSGIGVSGLSVSGTGVVGSSSSGFGVNGISSTTGSGVYGQNLSTGNGVSGISASGFGVYGQSNSIGGTGVGAFSSASLGRAIRGENTSSGTGVEGDSISGDGVYGFSSSGKGVHGVADSGFAGYFDGRVLVTGSVGIGTFASEANLEVRGNLTLDAGGNPLLFTAASGGEQNRYLALVNSPSTQSASGLKAGSILVSDDYGLGNPGKNDLWVKGNAYKPGGGSWGILSDERLKNVKGRFTPGLKAVMQLQPIRYEYKPNNALGINSDRAYVGFGAHAVQKIIPEAVTQNVNGYLLVNNDPIMWTVLNAVKEQQAQIEVQQKHIDEEKTRNRQLQERSREQQAEIDALKALVCSANKTAAICKPR